MKAALFQKLALGHFAPRIGKFAGTELAKMIESVLRALVYEFRSGCTAK